jgi:hypothetical protein
VARAVGACSRPPPNGRETRYVWRQIATTFGAPRCQFIGAHCVDAAVSAAMSAAISRSAIEVNLQVAEDLELERRQLHSQWKQRLEPAAYATALARRRYESLDPDDRLVAHALERDWDAALVAERKLSDNHRRAVQHEPEQLSEADEAGVRRLVENIPALWNAPSTTAADRQAIARIMLERVVIALRGATEHADLTCHRVGGIVTRR